jgi:hypothetical protein
METNVRPPGTGVSESVGIRTALAQGATHVVALRTRRSDEIAVAPSGMERRLVSRWFAKHAPGALAPYLDRAEVRREEEDLLATHPAVLQVRPPLGSVSIGRTEIGGGVLRRAVASGRRAAWEALEDADARSRR